MKIKLKELLLFMILLTLFLITLSTVNATTEYNTNNNSSLIKLLQMLIMEAQ